MWRGEGWLRHGNILCDKQVFCDRQVFGIPLDHETSMSKLMEATIPRRWESTRLARGKEVDPVDKIYS